MAHNSLTDVLTPSALEAASDFSDHLTRNGNQHILVGRTAVCYWTEQTRSVSELDIAVDDLSSLPPSLNKAFVVGHWEPRQGYGALIKRGTGGRTKIDILPMQKVRRPAVDVPLVVGGPKTIPVIDAESQLAISTWWLERRVTTNFGFGPHAKSVENVLRLMEVANIGDAEWLWGHLFDSLYANVGLRDAVYELSDLALRQRSASESLLKHRLKMLRKCGDCDYNNPNFKPIPGWRLAIKALVRKL